MKPGDMVLPRESSQEIYDKFFFMYGGDEVPWGENGNMIPTDLPYRREEIGVVLKTITHKFYGYTYVKLLTPSGVGWVRKSWLRVIGGGENLPPPVVR